jgi:hypothetical protein
LAPVPALDAHTFEFLCLFFQRACAGASTDDKRPVVGNEAIDQELGAFVRYDRRQKIIAIASSNWNPNPPIDASVERLENVQFDVRERCRLDHPTDEHNVLGAELPRQRDADLYTVAAFDDARDSEQRDGAGTEQYWPLCLHDVDPRFDAAEAEGPPSRVAKNWPLTCATTLSDSRHCHETAGQ